MLVAGRPTSGPSGTILAQYPYYMPIMWLRTNAGATALKYITSKFNYHWSIANSQTPIASATGIGAEWTSLPFAGLTDPNSSQYYAHIYSQTAGKFVAVADNQLLTGANAKCTIYGVANGSGGPVATQFCILQPDTGNPVFWSTDSNGGAGWVGGWSSF